MNLQDARILITGGSLGIGRVTAELLAEAGASVTITGRSMERLKPVADKIGATPIEADIADPAAIEHTWEQYWKNNDRLDVLINNAGIGVGAAVDELSRDDFERIFAVNVYGAAMMAKEAAKAFKKQQYGNLINVGSTAGRSGYPKGTIYCASKFALRGMTECWRAELRQHNVRVMLVSPSSVATAIGDPDRREREAPPNRLRSDEIAHAIKSLLTMDDRGFIPGVEVWATNP